MATITFECQRCGKLYTCGSEFGGKSLKCKQCGEVVRVPGGSKPRPVVPAVAGEESFALPPPSRAPIGSFAKTADSDEDPPPKKGMSTLRIIAICGTLVIGSTTLLNVLRMTSRNRLQPGPGENEQNATAPLAPFGSGAPGQPSGQPRAQIPAEVPTSDPRLPDTDEGREIVPGVMFHEMVIRSIQPAGFSAAGQSGKIWLYLPKGEHQPGSLPCVLIAAAGSNLITGMNLVEDDRPEHLPYAKAGFAVVAYELDGAVKDLESASEAEMRNCVSRFLDAQAGLVNARNALRFALTKVRQVDPERVYAVGHSSAATMAVLLAEYEPKIKACVAFAPIIDLNQRFDAGRRIPLIEVIPRAAAFFTKYNPAQNESKLNCPLFLFHAKDDSAVPVVPNVQAASRIRGLGKKVTLVLVDSGDHHDSMIREGIPKAIAWLKGLPQSADDQGTEVVTGPTRPPATGAPPGVNRRPNFQPSRPPRLGPRPGINRPPTRPGRPRGIR